ncbi:hypothetical protein QJS10_CPB04g01098 [Acorus calamus]|uniref:Zinc finger PHD-type domain-containing protein n=1 Tax=Acorus calamus TaxID=4465 RepID=A0AAV9F4H3_ACOCL|nr:hypothetical protein QJS10_CPB04g01098 [Acorus calamus]
MSWRREQGVGGGGVPGCGGCNVGERRWIHNIRHKGIYCSLCTSCVLKYHPGCFCVSCFDVLFEGSPPPPSPAADDAHLVRCSKCSSSVAHSRCLGEAADRGSFTCPTCVNPNFSFFDTVSGGDGGRTIDLEMAKALVAAARLASLSMSRAKASAWADAERRAKEAGMAGKRAKDALEKVVSGSMKEKGKAESEMKKKLKGSGFRSDGKDRLVAPHLNNVGPKDLVPVRVPPKVEGKEKSEVNGLVSASPAIATQLQQHRSQSVDVEQKVKANGLVDSKVGPQPSNASPLSQDGSANSQNNSGVIHPGLPNKSSVHS